jgi:glycosyltransferase involved in cell wall biosynthesis
MEHKLSAILVVRNEENKIRRCLDSLAGWLDEIVIIDQSSSDSTFSICKEYTPMVFTTARKNYCEPDRSMALSKTQNEWIIYIDADEVVSLESKEEMRALLKGEPEYNCYYMPRKNIFLGRWIKGSGWYPGYVLRLFKRDSIKFSDAIHTDVIPLSACGYLKNPLIHYTCEDLAEYYLKTERYTGILAMQAYAKGERINPLNFIFRIFLLPLIYFFYKYIIKKGFIDGFYGLVIAWLTMRTIFLTNAKLWKAQHESR